MNVTLLCKVVDNYGDIGFVYRLARALSSVRPDWNLSIVTDNLKSFSLLAPGLETGLPVQKYIWNKAVYSCPEWTFLQWNDDSACPAFFKNSPSPVILECFQCGRPDWLEKILFDDGQNSSQKKITRIIEIDYLTAEDYAEEFHKMPSATRSALVKKSFFMPGFTEKTGGLVLDKNWLDSVEAAKNQRKNQTAANEKSECKILMFSYERDFSRVVNALARFKNERMPNLKVYLAQGRGKDSFLSTWIQAGKPFDLAELPFFSQLEWDSFLASCDFLFVRGEDSLSRAALSSLPFVWHAYPQDDEYQAVKVQALLDRMKAFYEPDFFDLLSSYWKAYNVHSGGGEDSEEGLFNLLDYYFSHKDGRDGENSGDSLDDCLGISDFSASIKKAGDLAENLCGYIESLLC